MLLHAENEITEHSQQVGRLYGKVRKGCTAGNLTAAACVAICFRMLSMLRHFVIACSACVAHFLPHAQHA